MGTNEYIAHVRRLESGQFETHPLEEHLHAVGSMAAEFFDSTGAGNLALLAGLWHDLGKFSDEFQKRIRIKSGYDIEAHLEGKAGKVDHSTAGGIFAVERYGEQVGLMLSFPILGHHMGLQNLTDVRDRLKKTELRTRLPEIPQGLVPESVIHRGLKFGDRSLFIRMLFSALIDADRLDTERFMNPDQYARRKSPVPSLHEMNTRLDTAIGEKERSSPQTNLNRLRKEIRLHVEGLCNAPPGFFTLTVPTGGAKTLTSLSFALKHAIAKGKRRIIYAIPYTTIIEQTASIFRSILGPESVLEHHSNLDVDTWQENAWNRLLSENWDHPLVVTTNVQLLESLFSRRTSRCRKLHNLANSVIVFDEAQMLPAAYLQPVIDCLKDLVASYGVSIILCTATQPALSSRESTSFKFNGIDSARELAPDPDRLFAELKRVEINLPETWEHQSWSNIARDMAREETCIAIVNTRRSALELFRELGDGYHLSTSMCGQHRMDTLKSIRQDLEAGRSTRVVSTQLIEAGVDIDFPVVFRALTGLDSIAQSAGRCNREGKLPEAGKVHVFVPPVPSPYGHLLIAEQVTRKLLEHLNGRDPLLPDQFYAYFRELFWRKGQQGLDEKNIRDLALELRFEDVDAAFHLIEDSGQPVIVPYGSGSRIIDEMTERGVDPWRLRRAQRFMVNVRKRRYEELLASGAVRLLDGAYPVLVNPALYSDRTGLALDSYYSAEDLVI